MRNIRLTSTAEQQLEDIWIYSVAEWGEAQAEKYVCHIQTCLVGNAFLPAF